MAAQGIGQTDYFADGPRLALLRAQQQEAAAAAADAEQETARAERQDARETAMYLAGVQPGATLARATQMADVQAEIAGHREAIEKLERRLGRYKRQAAAEAEAVSRADAMASRSAVLDPVEAAVQRAREAHREFGRNTRTALSGAALGRRPKGGGYAVRSDQPVTCPDCITAGASAEESFLIHSDPSPVPVPDDAERREREVGRLMGLGYSRNVAETAMEIVR
jgi:hypothetical protein